MKIIHLMVPMSGRELLPERTSCLRKMSAKRGKHLSINPSGVDLRERETALSKRWLEAKSTFSAQELDLGSLDENQQSQPLIHQGLEARNKIPLTSAPTEKCVFTQANTI